VDGANKRSVGWRSRKKKPLNDVKMHNARWEAGESPSVGDLFVSGRSRETRLALLKDLDTRIAAAAGISPDDVLINLVEAPGENISFGQGEAQRANAVE
jgi:hypothetical protein